MLLQTFIYLFIFCKELETVNFKLLAVEKLAFSGTAALIASYRHAKSVPIIDFTLITSEFFFFFNEVLSMLSRSLC